MIHEYVVLTKNEIKRAKIKAENEKRREERIRRKLVISRIRDVQLVMVLPSLKKAAVITAKGFGASTITKKWMSYTLR